MKTAAPVPKKTSFLRSPSFRYISTGSRIIAFYCWQNEENAETTAKLSKVAERFRNFFTLHKIDVDIHVQ